MKVAPLTVFVQCRCKIKVAANSAQKSKKAESTKPAESKEDGGGFHIWFFF